MPFVNYAKEYIMFRILISITLLRSHNWYLLAADIKKTRVKADNLAVWGLGRQFGKIYFYYKFLGGVFYGNTRKKCAGVYMGIPIVYFGGYMHCTNNMFTVLFLMVYVPAICLWFCKLLSFGCIWVINFVLYIWLQKYIWVQKYIL